MKIFLINPPSVQGVKIVREGRCMQRQGAWTAVWSPISLALCAAVLEKEGFEVRLIDCIVKEIDSLKLQEMIAEFKPELIVLNTATPSIESDLSMARLAKEVIPELKTAALGIHVSVLPDECFQICPQLDYIIRQEPEFTLRDLVRAIASSTALNYVSGLSYREHNQIIHNQSRAWIDLDELPFPAWHLIDASDYLMPFKHIPFLLVATSRGCPYQCTFCADKAYYGTKLRLRSPKKLVDELSWVKEQVGVDEFLFWAESFTMNHRFVFDVCNEIVKRQLKVSWVCNSRVDNVSPELLARIKQAGCWMIGYGVESGNQEILNTAKKGTTLTQTRQAVKWAKQAGLEVTGHCILGLPGETEETIKQTVNLTLNIGLDFAQFYCAVPFPGSDLYLLAQEKHWLASHNWSQFEQNLSVLDLEQINHQRIMQARAQAYRRFYLRPSMIIKNLLKLRNFKQMKGFIRMLLDFITWL